MNKHDLNRIVCRSCYVAEIERHVQCVISLTMSGYTSDAVAYLDKLDGDKRVRVYAVVIARLEEEPSCYEHVSDLRSRYRDSSHEQS